MKKFTFWFSMFVLLILAGVGVKRLMGHPELVVMFHIPGAVCLVLSGMALKEVRNDTYAAEVAMVRKQHSLSDSDD